MGGVFNTVNVNLYHYAGNNPVKYTDPDGNSLFGIIAGIGCYIGAGAILAAGTFVVATTAGTTAIGIAPGAIALAGKLSVAGTAILTADYVAEKFAQSVGKSSPVLENGATSIASPSPLPPDNDNGDEYESNPKHHQNSKSPEPKNAKEMFDKSVKDPSKKNTRWYKDKDGVIHRFQGNNGKYHWNGSYDGKIKNMPSYIDNAIKNMPKGDL